MSILINLLPDTRKVKQKNQQRRQLFTGVAVVLWIICGSILVIMMLYRASQTLLIKSVTGDIAKKEQLLKGTDGLIDALTAQQHLASLPGLYSQRAYFTKFFDAYSQANPTDVYLSSLTVDASNELIVNGSAKTFAEVSKLAKALEAENVSVGKSASEGNQPYFKNVAIQSAARSNNAVAFTLKAELATGVISGN